MMSFNDCVHKNKVKKATSSSDSFCVGGKHRSATNNISGDIFSECSKVLFGYCSNCNRKRSMTVTDNTMQAEEFDSVFKNLSKFSAKAGKKLATNVLKKTR